MSLHFFYKMEIEHKKVYVWKTTKEQLMNATRISLDLCSDICSCAINKIHEQEFKRSIYGIMCDTSYTNQCSIEINSLQKELKFMQTELPNIIQQQLVIPLLPLCEQELNNAFAYRIDIPKDSFTNNVLTVLNCFVQEANLIESFDIVAKEYYVKPEVTVEYKEIRHIVPIKEC